MIEGFTLVWHDGDEYQHKSGFTCQAEAVRYWADMKTETLRFVEIHAEAELLFAL